MNHVYTLTLSVATLLILSCSNKGNGEKFYVECSERDCQIVHSTLKCNAIKGGIERIEPGDAWDSYLWCSKCMDEDLFEIACWGEKRKERPNEDSDDDL